MRAFYHHMLDLIFRSQAFHDRLRQVIDDGASPGGLSTVSDVQWLPNPYESSEGSDALQPAIRRLEQADVLFITSRFRSGSTLLWNMFHALDGFVSYYEPLNERRWFLPADKGYVDPTHRGVSNYHANYEAMEDLASHYREQWTYQDLAMHARSRDLGLKSYLDELISRSEGIPVLQFNRMNFRLPWLKAVYPDAKILHLYRHPRDQWVSILYGQEVPKDIKIADFAAYDRFYLLPWLRDLHRVFPCLNLPESASPYEAHYLIWRLSYLYGCDFADVSVSYEDLVNAPQNVVSTALAALGLPQTNMAIIDSLVAHDKTSAWQDYADDAWFAEKEHRCELRLSEMIDLLHRT